MPPTRPQRQTPEKPNSSGRVPSNFRGMGGGIPAASQTQIPTRFRSDSGGQEVQPASPPKSQTAGSSKPQTARERWNASTTAQKARGRVGHVRTAIVRQKELLAKQRQQIKSGSSPDARRAARMSEQKTIERIKFLARGNKRNIAQAMKMGWTADDLAPRGSRAPGVSSNSGSNSGSSSGGGSVTPTYSSPPPPPKPNSRPKTPPKPAKGTILYKATQEYQTHDQPEANVKNLDRFKKKFYANHKKALGGNINSLSDDQYRAIARYYKKRGGWGKGRYGLGSDSEWS